MRVPFTPEMIEMDEKIKPYRIVDGLEVSILEDAPDEIKELNIKLQEMVTYGVICEKLGFDVDTYKVPQADTEDANGDSPFRNLTIEELDFLSERMKRRESLC